jgi:hypothetical protein
MLHRSLSPDTIDLAAVVMPLMLEIAQGPGLRGEESRSVFRPQSCRLEGKSEVVDDPVCDLIVGDEGDGLHLGATSGADKRINQPRRPS